MQFKDNASTLAKQCSACQQVKSFEDFSNSRSARDGKNWECRACAAARISRYEAIKRVERPAPDKGYKACSTCEEIKAVTEFHRGARYVMGVHSSCIACRNKWGKQHREKISTLRGFPPPEKKCGRCGLIKAKDAFGTVRSKATKLRAVCKECRAKEYHSLTPEQKKERAEHTKLRVLYRLDKAAYNAMHAKQNGLCAICDRDLKHPHVDHNHQTKQIRGLLCAGCNIRLRIVEDETLLNRALQYLGRT